LQQGDTLVAYRRPGPHDRTVFGGRGGPVAKFFEEIATRKWASQREKELRAELETAEPWERRYIEDKIKRFKKVWKYGTRSVDIFLD
jgi:hypothetical protein